MNLYEAKNPILKDFAPVYEMRKAAFEFFHHNESDKIETVTKFLKDIIAASDFSMCVPAQYFGAIVESDFVKNGFETGHATTNGVNEVRKQTLENIMGVLTDGFEPKDFPKYGVLTGKNKAKDLIRDPDIFYHYGAIMLTLKKEAFMHRTTLTVGSSLNFLESVLKTPVPVYSPHPICIKGMPTKPVKPNTPVFNGFAFFYDMIKNQKITLDTPNQLMMQSEDMPGFENYELQFFGPIQFSKDIESITVLQIQGDEYETVMAYKEKLDSYGITVADLSENIWSAK